MRTGNVVNIKVLMLSGGCVQCVTLTQNLDETFSLKQVKWHKVCVSARHEHSAHTLGNICLNSRHPQGRALEENTGMFKL